MKEHNKDSGKIFYYTENEVRDLCLRAIKAKLSCTGIWSFIDWWNNVKKK